MENRESTGKLSSSKKRINYVPFSVIEGEDGIDDHIVKTERNKDSSDKCNKTEDTSR